MYTVQKIQSTDNLFRPEGKSGEIRNANKSWPVPNSILIHETSFTPRTHKKSSKHLEYDFLSIHIFVTAKTNKLHDCW